MYYIVFAHIDQRYDDERLTAKLFRSSVRFIYVSSALATSACLAYCIAIQMNDLFVSVWPDGQ